MALYSRETWIDAPLEDVWAFHSTVDGLVHLTPDWMNLRVESVVGPDGEPDPGVLAVGSVVELSIRPFGVGPRRSWTSRIVERERGDREAHFRDVMVDGPFREWVHTHRFLAENGGARIADRVEYALPGPLGALSGLARPFFEPTFAARHRRTRERLER